MPRVKELIVTYRAHPSGAVLDRALLSPQDAAALFLPLLAHEPQECAVVACLTAKFRLIAVREISRGTLSSCIIEPRDVFTPALLANAAAVLVAHNHPSGDPSPSPDDMRVTVQLRNAAAVLGIGFNDHIIIGDQQYYSFKQGGLL